MDLGLRGLEQNVVESERLADIHANPLGRTP
jgi:hypothetical protein